MATEQSETGAKDPDAHGSPDTPGSRDTSDSSDTSVGGSRVSWDRVYSFAGNIVAPATALSALLFYFGYVSTRAQYLYFGLDVDTIGPSTQAFVMRSPQPLLVPLLV